MHVTMTESGDVWYVYMDLHQNTAIVYGLLQCEWFLTQTCPWVQSKMVDEGGHNLLPIIADDPGMTK